MADQLIFYLNGDEVSIAAPDPRITLLDFLHTPSVNLKGAKKGCGQGGCGSCTILLSGWDDRANAVRHRAVNACLRPLVSVAGMAVTTIEGIGSVGSSLSPVQHIVAAANGSQCGYCTPGFVMNMQGFLAANEGMEISKKQVEKAFDGNLCRCTGYRPILFGMKHFADDFTTDDQKGNMKCKIDPATAVPVSKEIFDGFPKVLKKPPEPLHFQIEDSQGCFQWFRPTSLDQVKDILTKIPEGTNPRFVAGNTSVGVYPNWGGAMYPFQVDISHIPELRNEISLDGGELVFGAATTYTQLIDFLVRALASESGTNQDFRPALAALKQMAEATGGTVLRNAGTIAGNLMMTAKHGSPQEWQENFVVGARTFLHQDKATSKKSGFASDLLLVLMVLGARVDFYRAEKGETDELPVSEFTDLCYQNGPQQADTLLVLSIRVPLTGKTEFIRAYKTGQRPDDSRAIVNACFRLQVDSNNKITRVRAALGGSNLIPFFALSFQESLTGKTWGEALPDIAYAALGKDMEEAMSGTPGDSFYAPDYKLKLTWGFFFKFFVHVSKSIAPDLIPADESDAGRTWERPVSRGSQIFPDLKPAGALREPYLKLSAYEQATGQALYTHNIPLPPDGLFGHYVLSTRPLADFNFKTPDTDPATPQQTEAWLKENFPGVKTVITAHDLPQSLQTKACDDPYLCIDDVTCAGQPIAVVIANNDTVAGSAASAFQYKCISYTDKDEEPIYTIPDAVEKDSIFEDTQTEVHIWKVTRPDSEFSWKDTPESVVGGVNCDISSIEQHTGAQCHFYLETQSCAAFPRDGNTLEIRASSQSPMSVHTAVCSVTGLPANRVNVKIDRLGGGFGGKTCRTPYPAVAAALAAVKTGKPVKMALYRGVDTTFMGKRHPALGKSALAVGNGRDDPQNKGKIMGRHTNIWTDGGNTYDCSYPVLNCMMLKSDGPYYVPNSQVVGDVCRTNKSTNTALRSFGMIQATLILEEGVERAAHSLGMQPEDLRGKNLNQMGDLTPYGEPLNSCYMSHVWEYVLEKSDFGNRLEQVKKFNRENKWKKQGISAIPMMYGLGYNAEFLQQGGAFIEVFSHDGTVLGHTGGIETGQGLATKMAQLAASELRLPLRLVQMAPFEASVIPNPSSTGASTGTDLNGGAIVEAAQNLRKRLEEFTYGLRDEKGITWCRDNCINFWDYEEGWEALDPNGPEGKLIWQNIVSQAYMQRINLSSQTRYKQPGSSFTVKNIAFKNPEFTQTVNGFIGQTYSAAVSQVEIDVLTGETRVLRSDVCYDAGESLNPAVDVGQVEGAFVMGIGNVLTEQSVFVDGIEKAVNTWDYKIPGSSTIPEEFNVILFPRETVTDVPPNPNLVKSSKAIGEPPLVLASSVFFAVKHAILANRQQMGKSGWFGLASPATPQRIRQTCICNFPKTSK